MGAIEPHHLGALAIVAMAVATNLMRATGFWVMSYVPLTPRLLRMLEALPGSIVAAVVLPIAANGGPAVALAIIAALIGMTASRNELLAIFIGMVTAASIRSVGI